MSRSFKPSILTANDLLSGEVVYFDKESLWSNEFKDARVFTEQDKAEAALAGANDGEVVGAYLVSVHLEGSIASPDHFREDFRATGPSNYFHGKQADV